MAKSLVTIFCVIASATLIHAAEEMEREELRTIAYTYLANRQSFNHFRCRFKATFGTVRRPEDAFGGRYDDSFVADGFWVVDGPKLRFELLCDLSVIPRRHRGDNTVSLPLIPNMHLGNSSLHLSMSLFGIGSVQTPELESPGIRYTPFEMGWMAEDEVFGPPQLILEGLKGKASRCVLLGPKKHNQIEVTAVEIKEDHATTTLFLDPAKAYLPIEATRSDDTGMDFRCVADDIRMCGKDKWFPYRSVYVRWPWKGETAYKVIRFEVTELKVDQPISEDVFRLEVPKGMTIKDPITDKQLTWDADEPVNLQSLPDILERVRSGQNTSSQLSPARRNRNFGLTALGIGVGLLAAVCVLYFHNRRKRKPNAA